MRIVKTPEEGRAATRDQESKIYSLKSEIYNLQAAICILQSAFCIQAPSVNPASLLYFDPLGESWL